MADTAFQHPLLAPGEPPAFTLVRPESASSFVFTCDHASKLLPRSVGSLGITEAELGMHIGWDIGAAALARLVAAAFDAPLIESGYSRLVIDCNRPLDAPSLVPTVSGGIRIPGNEGLSAAAIVERQEMLFQPYHQAISDLLDARLKRRQPTALFAMHSFTPDYPGEVRPWHLDFANRHDRRLAGLLLETFDEPGILVGDNKPFPVDETDYGIPVHGEHRGLPHVLIEVRQDMLSDAAGIALWAERLVTLLRRLTPEIEQFAKDSLPS